jgi:ankyrin repeat protein
MRPIDKQLINAASYGHIEIVRALLEKGADPNIKDYDGQHALTKALYKGYTDVVILLLKKGADPNIPDIKVDYEQSILFFALQKRYKDIVLALIESGVVDLNEKDMNGYTALMIASWDGYRYIVRALLKHGADPNIKESRHGYTALMEATSEGRADIVRVLLEYGADPMIKNRYGKTALDLAIYYKNKDVVDYLSRYLERKVIMPLIQQTALKKGKNPHRQTTLPIDLLRLVANTLGFSKRKNKSKKKIKNIF